MSTTPWHLWGTLETLQKEATVGLGVPIAITTQQLVKIMYGRPETWHWLLAIELVTAADVAPGGGATLQVQYDLTVGLGRSAVVIPSFERFAYTWGTAIFPTATDSPNKQQLWSTQVFAPNRVQNPVASLDLPNTTEQIVAESINLQARVLYTRNAIAGADIATLNIHAYFAPKTHVRPDWYLNDVPKATQFPGHETAGR